MSNTYIALFAKGFVRYDEIRNKEVLSFLFSHGIVPTGSREYLYKTYLSEFAHNKVKLSILGVGVVAFADFSCQARVVGTAFYLLTPAVWHTKEEFSVLEDMYEMFQGDLENDKEKRIHEVC